MILNPNSPKTGYVKCVNRSEEDFVFRSDFSQSSHEKDIDVCNFLANVIEGASSLMSDKKLQSLQNRN